MQPVNSLDIAQSKRDYVKEHLPLTVRFHYMTASPITLAAIDQDFRDGRYSPNHFVSAMNFVEDMIRTQPQLTAAFTRALDLFLPQTQPNGPSRPT